MINGRRSDDSNSMAALHKTRAIIEFTPDGRVLKANQLFCQVMGYSEKEIVGQHHSIFVDKDEAQSPDYKAFWKGLAAGNAYDRQYKRFAKGGREVWIEASYNPVFRHGKPYKIIKIATDITALKHKAMHDEAVLAALHRSQALIEFKLDGTIIDANQNFLDAIGYSLEEIRGGHHSMFCEPSFTKSAAYQEFWDKLRGGAIISEEFERIGKGGRRIFIMASYNPIIDDAGKVVGVIKFATDVTQRVQNVRSLATAMRAMADGDLSLRIDEAFTPVLAQLRDDYNNASDKLCSLLRETQSHTESIASASSQVRSASDDLAKRSEQAASSIERTAAALEETSTNVENASAQAQEAADLVTRTRESALESGDVVKNAITAMGQIEESSSKVANIIGIIDEIAFQTGLLALNAGVEAARAGDAGRGFAVVAQEVRELAQRSSTAAKEIKELVGTSVDQVNNGVSLVNRAGEALHQIVEQVGEINERIASITEGSKEQAVGLREISKSVNLVDENAQQNAAMVEEMTAASHSLAADASMTLSLIERFDLGNGRSVANDQAARSPVARMGDQLAAAFG